MSRLKSLIVCVAILLYLWLLLFPCSLNPIAIGSFFIQLARGNISSTRGYPELLKYSKLVQDSRVRGHAPAGSLSASDNANHRMGTGTTQSPGMPPESPPVSIAPNAQSGGDHGNPRNKTVVPVTSGSGGRIIGLGLKNYLTKIHMTTDDPLPPSSMLRPHPTTPASVDELSVAYLITVHNNATMVGAIELVNALQSPQHCFFIHIDRKVPEEACSTFLKAFSGLPNVKFAPRQWDVSWGSEEIVELEMELLTMAVNENLERKTKRRYMEKECGQEEVQEVEDVAESSSWDLLGRRVNGSLPLWPPIQDNADMRRRDQNFNGGRSQSRCNRRLRPWKFAVFLCGASFPIHSNLYIQHQLSLLPHSSNIVFHAYRQKSCNFGQTVFQDEVAEPCSKSMARCLDVECAAMSFTPNNSVVYKGMQWAMLSAAFSEWVIENEDTYVKPWKEFFRDAWTPDELFFPTLLMNSPFRDTGLVAERPNTYVMPSQLIGTMYTDWNNACLSHKNKRLHLSPCYLGEKDFESMVASGYLFARKLSPGDPVKQEMAKFRREEEMRIRKAWGFVS